MARRGPKGKLTTNTPSQIQFLASKGFTVPEIAKALCVTQKTINEWANEYPEIGMALKMGRDQIDAMVESSLFNRAMGYNHKETKVFNYHGQIIEHTIEKHVPPDVTAQIFWLKNRKPQLWRDKIDIEAHKEKPKLVDARKTFEQFAIDAGYPKPYPKQIEMYDFSFNQTKPRMILGARGYGKTDYITILGVAYDVYLNGTTNLIISKSKTRNTAIIGEIEKALKDNGVDLEQANSSVIRVKGSVGKDHSVEAITIKTSMRGRHPFRIIMDDPVTEEDVSEATRSLVKRKYNEVLKLKDNVCIIGQPAHKHDLYSELRDKVDLMELPFGTIPELDHDLEAQRLAGVDENSIQASYFLKIISDESAPFDKIQFIDQYPQGVSSVAFIDPSFEGGDYTAMAIVTAMMQGVAVVGFCWKKSWSNCLDQIVEKVNRYQVKRLAFETNSLGEMPIDLLRGVVPSDVGVVGRKSTTNKHARIMNAGTFAHQIFLAQESDTIFKKQVVEYESTSKHDDAPDALASCLIWIGLIRGK